ncbi:MAG: heavy metal translocating P-type ATPase [Lachnospiraceae bacterium]|nr:heavy metal translocating P-type ATPase [Lachnospiraceae bacterium]
MTNKQKKTRTRILITLVWFVLLLLFERRIALFVENTAVLAGVSEAGQISAITGCVMFLLFFPPYILIGHDVILRAFKNIRHGQIFDENFLMMIATFAAFGVGEYTEALAVMLFYQIGELFQSYAVGRSRASITEMMRIAPEYANLEGEDGTVTEKDPDEVPVGAVIVVKAGEKIPLDGTVLEGESFVDTAALTGESVPRRVCPGEDVISGCVNGEGTLRVRVNKIYEDSTVARILEMVENASSKKARLENFITRFAKYYTPVVTLGAALLAVIPPVVLMLAGESPRWGDWISRACIFLIVSCPCALVISVPLGFFGGIGAASRIGVLVKGSNFLEAIADTTTVVMDKTGTLTRGEFRVTRLIPAGETTETELLALAACGESFSAHPIAASVNAACREAQERGELTAIRADRMTECREIPGHGTICLLDEKPLLTGNAALLADNGVRDDRITRDMENAAGTVVLIAYDGHYRGALVISDTIKDGAAAALSDMKRIGVKRTVMLTGDRREAACEVASSLGIDEVRAELLPADKVDAVEELLAARQGKEKLAFVGDGINDAPVLMRADVGIAMGSLGSDAAIEAADIVLMDDDVTKIARLVQIGRRTLTIVRQNVIFAIGVKVIVLLLGALGIATMWLAVFADVGVAVLAILNSMRALKT